MDNVEFVYKSTASKEAILWESHCHPYFEIIAVIEGTVELSSEAPRSMMMHSTTFVMLPSAASGTRTSSLPTSSRGE